MKKFFPTSFSCGWSFLMRICEYSRKKQYNIASFAEENISRIHLGRQLASAPAVVMRQPAFAGARRLPEHEKTISISGI